MRKKTFPPHTFVDNPHTTGAIEGIKIIKETVDRALAPKAHDKQTAGAITIIKEKGIKPLARHMIGKKNSPPAPFPEELRNIIAQEIEQRLTRGNVDTLDIGLGK